MSAEGDHKGCRTQHMPLADGTDCGHGMVCSFTFYAFIRDQTFYRGPHHAVSGLYCESVKVHVIFWGQSSVLT